MGKLNKLRSLILGPDYLDTETSVNNILNKIKPTLIDYTSSKYETLISFLLGMQKNQNGENIKYTSNLITSLFKELKTIVPEPYRINRYKLIETLVSSTPELGQALAVYVDNILSPDDYLKNVLILNISDYENIKIATKDKINMLLKKHKFEEKCIAWITKTLLKGDFFIEIRKIDLNNPTLIADNTIKPLNTISHPFNEYYRINCEYINEEWHFTSRNYFLESDINICQINEKDDKNPISVVLIPWDPQNIIPLIYQDYIFGYIVVINKMSIHNTALISPTSQQQQSSSSSSFSQPKTPFYTQMSNNMNIINSFLQKLLIIYPKLKDLLEEKPFLQIDLAYLINQYAVNNYANIDLLLIPAERMEFFKIPSAINDPYGESIFSSTLLTGKYLNALEHAMTIYRLTRAAERRIFKIEVGADRDASNYIQQVIRKTKQKEIYLRDPYALDSLISEMNMFEDYYVPISEGKEFFSVDTLPGGELTSKIDDVEYIRNKLISGLGIPAIYLSQTDASESKYTLSQENVKFARTIIKLQKIFTDSITSLFKKVWVAEYGTEDMFVIDDIKLTFQPPMAIQMERLAEIYTNIQTTVTTLSDLLPSIKKDFIAKKFITPFITKIELEEMERLSKLEPKEKTPGEEEELFGTETPPTKKKGKEESEGGIF